MNSLKEMLKQLSLVIVFLIFAGGILYVGWQIKRYFNYNFGYEAQVKEQICEMVKHEHLKNPEDCL